MTERLHKNKEYSSNGGFTLVELLVVLVLMVILVTVSIFGVIAWQEYARFTRQNEYAQTIYVAAQNQLTEYGVNGKKYELIDKCNKLQAIDLSKLKDTDGKSYELDKVWVESEGETGTNVSKYRGKVYSVSCAKGEYADFVEGKQVSDEAMMLFNLISSYVYDKSILNASICIEFDPEDSQVFSVLYSDYANDFTYDKDSTDKTCIISREDVFRKDHLIGYYGVDTLYKATSTKLLKPTIVNVKLNNEETLNLSFKLGNEQTALGKLEYDIIVYDKDTDREILSFTIDGTKIKNKDNLEPIKCDVTRYLYDSAGKSTESVLAECGLLAWIEASDDSDDGTIRIIFDAADLNATTTLDFYNDGYKDTYSFLRFGVPAQNIYCTVSGHKEGFKTTAVKKSNTQAALFASAEFTGASSEQFDHYDYKIRNARHLYNIRYIEDKSPLNSNDVKGYIIDSSQDVCFSLSGNVNWEDFIHDNGLFDSENNGIYAAEEDSLFPSVEVLRSGDSLIGNGYTISGLNISTDFNIENNVYNRITDATPTGLFALNLGLISNLSLDEITIEGVDKTGAFCGDNAGNLEKLHVLNSENDSVITGKNYTGGITGMLSGKGEVLLDELYNSAMVKGSAYIGGIIGIVSADDVNGQSVTIQNCHNDGNVTGINDAQSESRFIGGIVGMCKNETALCDNVLIKDCDSTSYITEVDEDNIDSLTQGIYVGGIVGYNYFGKVVNCGTSVPRGKSGYIFGDRYVGGIVGFNQGPVDSENVVGGSDGDPGVNSISIIGKMYVGGIVGCNAGTDNDIIADSLIIVEPDTNPNPGIILNNWINKGYVIATDKYSGGITGYNAGNIINCNSEVSHIGIEDFSLVAGDYSGGIAGYNNGQIGTKDDLLSTISYVSGRNYVGGIVGYNDVDAVITGYELEGGYINGIGCFVGGYAGVNASVKLLMDDENQIQKISANPNLVTGKYFIGGTVGGNVLNTDTVVKAAFATDNFLGQIEAKAFAGGFIGYNAVIKTDTTEYIDSLLEKVKYNDSAEQVAVVLNGLSGDLMGNTINGSMVISGVNDTSTQSNVGKISGEIYLGGILGYSDESTELLIENVRNIAPVIATGSIEANEHPDDSFVDYNGNKFTYSYSGGIIGRVNKNTTLKNCSNENAKNIVTKGTYTAGLCEINEGTIKDCVVTSIGGNRNDYVAGLCAINKESGIIEGCHFDETTIIGRNYIAGIAVENYGIIRDFYVENGLVSPGGNPTVKTIVKDFSDVTMNAKSNVGVIVARNFSTGIIEISNSISNCSITISGDRSGICAAYNEGKVITQNSAVVTGSVSGNSDIGGIIGFNMSIYSIKNFTNKAVVTSLAGFAGGIIGNNRGKGKIENCHNYGVITATKSGNAGGITANNYGVIINCGNYSEIYSPNGMCGGIAAINNKNSLIQGCFVTSEKENQRLKISSRSVVGGISAQNNGTIENSWIKNVDVVNYSGSEDSCIGAVTGLNKGLITYTEKKIGTFANNKYYVVYLCSAKTYSDRSLTGGIVGKNETTGVIEGIVWEDSKTPYSYVNCEIGFVGDYANNAVFGGVCGFNKGNIRNIGVDSTIKSYFGSEDAGTGGIAGVSQGESDNVALIESCTFDGSVYGVGSAANILYIGGIVGSNNTDSTIRYCKVGVMSDSRIYAGSDEKDNNSKNASFTYLGGICGFNHGSIVACDNSDNEYSVSISLYAGMLGGIVGYNDKYATINGMEKDDGTVVYTSTGSKWSVTSYYYCNDSGTGGIIGYNASGEDFNHVMNKADVVCVYNADNNSAGGIVGRNENHYRNGTYFTDCINYGDIKCSKRSGGMIGVMKFQPVSFKNCINYGNMDAIFASGFVASFYSSDNLIVYFKDCINHGNIGTAGTDKASGFLAAFEVNSSQKVYFGNCVNTGYVYSKSMVGAFCAETTNGGSHFVNISKCRNYGKCLLLNKDTNFGLSSNTTGMIKDSLLFNEFDTVFGNVDLSDNNYYLADQPAESKKVTFSISGATMDNAKGPMIGIMGDEKNNSDYLYRTNFQSSNMSSNPIVLKLSAHDGYADMDKFYITWCNGGSATSTNRQYYYDVTFEDSEHNIKQYLNRVSEGYYEPSSSLDVIDLKDTATYVDAGFNGKILNVTISIKKVLQSSSSTKDDFKTATTYVNLRSFTWSKAGGEREVFKVFSGSLENSGTIISCLPDGSNFRLVVMGSTVISGLKNNADSDNYKTDSAQYSDSLYRIPVYEEVDPKYIEFITKTKTINKKLLAPANITMTSTIGELRFTWDEVSNAYDYEVRYRYLDKDKNPVSDYVYDSTEGFAFYNFKAKADYNGGYIEFQVRAVNGYEITNKDAKYSSDWGTLVNSELAALPIPEYHLEIIGENECIAILDNADDYKVDNGYLDCVIKISNGVSFTIKPSVGYSTISQSINFIPNAIIQANAVPNSSISGKYITSANSLIQMCVIGTNDTNVNTYGKYYTSTFMGFYGSVSDTLNYRIKFARSSLDYDLYIITELSANNSNGMEISYSHEISHITSRADAYATISDIPTDIIGSDTFKVRTYLWKTQGDFLYYGHEVANGITYDELAGVKDDGLYTISGNTCQKAPSASIWESASKLKPGYVICMESDGTYSVIYSVSMVYTDTPFGMKYVERTYTYDADKHVYKNDADETEIPIFNAPEDITMTIDDTGSIYDFKWDQGKNYKNSVYNAEIIGIAVDDSEVSLATVAGLTSPEWTVYDAENNWNYKNVKIKITRVGELDSSGSTKTLYNYSEKTFNLKLRIDQLSMPGMNLTNNDDGTVNKDELKYIISWDSVVDEEQLKELGGYLITIRSSKDGNEQTKYFALKYPDGTTLDTMSDNIPEESTYIAGKTSDEGCSAVFDFSKYEGGTSISISIMAVAKNDAKIYRNALDGISYETVLPVRLSTPNINKIHISHEYDLNDFVSLDEFENGLSLDFSDSAAKDKQGNYQIAYAVYSDYDINDSVYAFAGPMWSARAMVVLADKNENVAMTGNLLESTYDFKNLSAEYAGRFLKIASKSISVSNISSWWTDEDPDTTVTDFAWIRLPRVQISEPTVFNNHSIRYYYQNKWYNDTIGLNEAEVFSFDMESFEFDTVDYADGYRIKLTASPEDGKEGSANEEYYLIIKKSANGFKLSFSGPSNVENEYEITPDNSSVELPYERIFSYSGMDVIENTLISYDFDNEKFTITLPDTYSVNDIAFDGMQFLYTYEVMVQAISYDADTEAVNAFYENSDIVRYFRNIENQMKFEKKQLKYDDASMKK